LLATSNIGQPPTCIQRKGKKRGGTEGRKDGKSVKGGEEREWEGEEGRQREREGNKEQRGKKETERTGEQRVVDRRKGKRREVER